MLRSLLLYGSLVVFSVLVGIFIGGGPSALRSSDLVAVVPSTTVAPATTTEPTSTTVATLSTTAPTTTITTTTTVPTTTAPETTAPNPTSTTPATTAATTSTTTTTEPAAVAVDRDELRVAVANGSGVQGIAGRTAVDLIELGYLDPRTLNAERLNATTVFHQSGFEAEAARLAADAGFDSEATAPADTAPNTFSDVEYDLLLVLGIDNAATDEAPAVPSTEASDATS